MHRRELILGLSCAAAAGTAAALKPRRNVSLLGRRQLASVVPAAFAGWTSTDMQDAFALNQNDLEHRLYNQVLSRLYMESATGQGVVMLLAHGERQSDELQLHRPEVCYPAFGFKLVRNEPTKIEVSPDVVIPGRRLLAEQEDRREMVVYWSRMGEDLPASASEQRQVRFKNAVHGLVPDGLLCRFSTPLATDAFGDGQVLMQRFIQGLVLHMRSADRAVMIGTARAEALAHV